MESIQEFVDRTKGPLVPYVDSWYPWVYAHHYLRTEMDLLPAELGKVGPRLSLDEAVELVQVWSGLTGESIDASARALADAYLDRWGVTPDQIDRPVQRYWTGTPQPVAANAPAETVVRGEVVRGEVVVAEVVAVPNQAPVSPAPAPAPRNVNRANRRAVKPRPDNSVAVPEPAARPVPVPEEHLVS